ncbi:MAG TPA: hypothetical protein VK422_03655 [Pyrinomonadaceae bacterium]|nr:hypothetical protein [Pyrinomonadaceae bacterium]
MNIRRFTVSTFAALTLAALLPAIDANAQTIWDRVRDRARQEQDDNRRRDDDWGRGRRNDRLNDYERRQLREAARRISNRSHDLQRDVDRLLDQSRYDGTRREDRVNNEVRRFREVADRFRDRAGDSDNLNRSADEARQLLSEAERLGNFLRRLRMDNRTRNDWSQIRQDLRTVANIYGFRFRDFDDYRGGGRGW